jgi:hypothetical protein
LMVLITNPFSLLALILPMRHQTTLQMATLAVLLIIVIIRW